MAAVSDNHACAKLPTRPESASCPSRVVTFFSTTEAFHTEHWTNRLGAPCIYISSVLCRWKATLLIALVRLITFLLPSSFFFFFTFLSSFFFLLFFFFFFMLFFLLSRFLFLVRFIFPFETSSLFSSLLRWRRDAVLTHALLCCLLYVPTASA